LTRCSILASGRSNRSVSTSTSTIGNLLLLFSWLEDLEAAHESVINGHHSACIVELTTIVGSGEQSNELSLCKELIAVLNYLMRTANQVNIVLLIESRYDFLTESKGDTTVVFTPPLNILIGIGPEEVAQEASVRDVSRSHNSLDLLERAKLRAQTTVHAENFFINNSSNGKAIEAVSEGLPQLDVISAFALVVETINSVDGGALVVSSEQEEIFGILDLVSEEKAHSLEGLLASVNVITQEEVVGIGREATVLEESQQVVVLTMHITYKC
jgi:hypothetical protein